MPATPTDRTIDDILSVRGGHLHVEDVDCLELAARFGTPLYVLSETRLRANARRYRAAFAASWPFGDIRVLPSLKANFSLAVAALLADEGLGCDVFGASEFAVAMRSGFAPGLISLNGSSKDQDLIDAAVRAGARITLDSEAELGRAIDAARRLGTTAQIRLRVRPDYAGMDVPTDFLEEMVPVSEATRRYKAGIPADDLPAVGREALVHPEVHLRGLMVHLPRHRTDLATWREATERFADVVAQVTGSWGSWRPEELDLGGGLPTRRDPTGKLIERLHEAVGGQTPSVEEYARTIGDALAARLRAHGLDPEGIAIEVEPGRGLFADAGVHLTTVRHIKREATPLAWTWVETDTSEMFLLDSLIEHNLWTCVAAGRMDEEATDTVDVVGRSCGFDLVVPDALLPPSHEGDVLAFLDTGAYQEASATNFNAMPRPATVLVRGGEAETIKRAETIEDVFARDIVPARLQGKDA